MKKIIVSFLVVASFFVVAMPAMAKPEKVKVCHVIEANDVIPFSFSGPPTVNLHFGKVISVSEMAVEAHTGHGDSTSFFGGDEAAGPIDAFKAAGANLPAANCYTVTPIVN